MKVETTYDVFELEGELIVGDWEGDPDVPRGVNHLAPYVDEFQIIVNGDGVDPKYFTKDTIEAFREALEIAGVEDLSYDH